MSTAVDDRARRRARARAVAASIADAPFAPRRFRTDPERPLRGSDRRRRRRPSPAARPPAASRLSRRRVIAAVLLAQAVALLGLLVLPAFRVTTVDVRGDHLLDRGAVLAAAEISPSQSIFTVDGDAIRARLERLPWVRTAAVETDLPHTLRITVVEWDPVLRLRRPDGDLLLAASGSVLRLVPTRAAGVPAAPILLDDRPAALVGGTPSLDPVLTRTLEVIAARFHDVFGCDVADFHWLADGTLTIEASTWWRAVLGHEDTPTQIAAIPDQITALAALRGRVDLVKPAFGYIDLENPAAPAVGGRPQPPSVAPPAAAPAPSSPATAGPSAAATPAPTPAPTPRPTPTPLNFGTITPPPH